MPVCIVFAYEKARVRARPLARPHGAVLRQGPRSDNSCLFVLYLLMKRQGLGQGPGKAPWGSFKARPQGRQFMLVCIVFAYEKARFRARPLARPHGAVLRQGPRGDNSCLFVLNNKV